MSPGGFTSGATAVSVEAIGFSVAVVVVVLDEAVVSVCVASFFAVHATAKITRRIGVSFRIVKLLSGAIHSSNFGATKLNSGQETHVHITGRLLPRVLRASS